MRKLFLALLLPAHAALAQPPVTIQLEPFATGLSGMVDIVHAGDDRLFIVLQPGVIKIVGADGIVHPTPFLDIQDHVNSGGEQGLLGLAFDPNYQENGFFYVNYIFGSGNGSTRISRFRVTEDPNVADPSSEQTVYMWPQPASNHNGGDLDFGPDGYLYIPLGDGGGGGDTFNNAQDLTDPLGDIIRLDVSDPDTTYTLPATNPWLNAISDTLPEIWASGLRNPFRFGFDALTGDLWIGDVGQSSFEEVDFWPAGDNSGPNFGWRCYEGNAPYNTAGCAPQSTYVAPVSVHTWGAQGWCSVMGGRVYRGTEFPRLYGHYIYTDYCGGQFYSLIPDGNGGWTRTQVRSTAQNSFTCIGEDSALEMYAGNTGNGTLYHIVDPCPSLVTPVVSQNGSTLTSSEAEGYTWYLNGTVLAGETTQTITLTQSGNYYVVASFGAGCTAASEEQFVSLVGVTEQLAMSILVFPVPADDQLVVEGIPQHIKNVQLIDVTGRMVVEASVKGTSRHVLSTVKLNAGQYTLVFRDTSGSVQYERRVSIQH